MVAIALTLAQVGARSADIYQRKGTYPGAALIGLVWRYNLHALRRASDRMRCASGSTRTVGWCVVKQRDRTRARGVVVVCVAVVIDPARGRACRDRRRGRSNKDIMADDEDGGTEETADGGDGGAVVGGERSLSLSPQAYHSESCVRSSHTPTCAVIIPADVPCTAARTAGYQSCRAASLKTRCTER